MLWATRAAPTIEAGVSAFPVRLRRAGHSFLTLNERKFHETSHPLSKPIALSKELQTKSCPNQADEAEFSVSTGALRTETANQNI
jgi:hypothetical protein